MVQDQRRGGVELVAHGGRPGGIGGKSSGRAGAAPAPGAAAGRSTSPSRASGASCMPGIRWSMCARQAQLSRIHGDGTVYRAIE